MPKFYLSSPALLFFLLLFAAGVRGQDIAPLPSPTAANLGLYGEIPVSYYTGTPNISIPLYEIKGRQVNVPITLTYHPSGIRPEIHPGPTGLGWSLQAGGIITRTVKGNVPDENDRLSASISFLTGPASTLALLGDTDGYLSLISSFDWMTKSNWKEHLKNKLITCDTCAQEIAAPSGDWEADEFSFNFLGISGKFYLDQYGKFQVQSDRALTVEYDGFIRAIDLQLKYNPNNSTGSDLYSHRMFKQFIITDELGTRYYFGGTGAVEIADPITYGLKGDGTVAVPNRSHMHATSWFLTKIESADGVDVIDFSYERGPFISQIYWKYGRFVIKTASSDEERRSYMPEGNFISPVYLSEIKQMNGDRIAFTYGKSGDLSYEIAPGGVGSHVIDQDFFYYNTSLYYHSTEPFPLLHMTDAIPRLRNSYPDNILEHLQWLRMDRMEVLSTRGTDANKIIEFTYNNNPEERLFLEKLNIYGNSFSWLHGKSLTYSFTYKDRQKLLPYLETLTDHWGFNNGYKFFITEGIETWKDVNSLYTTSGVLDTLYYPTGGYTAFEYTVHDYSKTVNYLNRNQMDNNAGIAGGLRIRKITNNDLMGHPVVREFVYRDTLLASSRSSGVLNVLPYYSYTAWTTDCANIRLFYPYESERPVIPLTKGNDGLYIGYTTVWEKKSSGNDNGYTKYAYTNHDNGHHDVLLENALWKREAFYDNPHNSRFFERGRLLEKRHYDSNGQLIWKESTAWNRYGKQDEWGNPRSTLLMAGVYGTSFQILCSSVAYLNYCYKFLPSRKEEIMYSPQSGTLVTAKDYTYNSDYLLQTETTVNSAGHRLITRYHYPKDILNQRTVENEAAYRWMVDNNVIGRPVEQIHYKDEKVTAAN